MDHELWRHNGRGECVACPVDGGESGYCAVGERVWQGTHADHDEELEPVVFEGEGERGKALVVCDEAVDEVFEDGARENEGGGGAGDGGGCGYEPAGMACQYVMISD